MYLAVPYYKYVYSGPRPPSSALLHLIIFNLLAILQEV